MPSYKHVYGAGDTPITSDDEDDDNQVINNKETMGGNSNFIETHEDDGDIGNQTPYLMMIQKMMI